MKTVIAGSRSIHSMPLVERAIEERPFEITKVVHGAARGVDSLAEAWAILHGIPTEVYEPNYSEYESHKAPLIRNEKMAEVAEAGIIIWDGESSGTQHMKSQLERQNLPKVDEKIFKTGQTQCLVFYYNE